MDMTSIYRHLITNANRIEAELVGRLKNHPDTDSTRVLKAAIKNRQFSSSCQEVKTHMLDDDGMECLLFIQLFGIAHNRMGVSWSESSIIEWVRLL